MKTAAILLATLALLGCGKEESSGKQESTAKQVNDPSLPDAKTIGRIEKLAKSLVAKGGGQQVDLKNISAFTRYYAFKTDQGRQFIWGELYPGGRGELHVVHADEVRYIFDGGCGAVSLWYDVTEGRVTSVQCHGLA